jgi:hypothetical protein
MSSKSTIAICRKSLADLTLKVEAKSLCVLVKAVFNSGFDVRLPTNPVKKSVIGFPPGGAAAVNVACL